MRRNSASPTVSWYCRRTCARRGGAFDSAAASSILPSASRESMRSAVARALPGLPGAISWYRSSAPLASLSVRSSAAVPNASSATSQRPRLSRRALGAATLKARNEVVVLLARPSQVAGLDVTEPANLLRYGGNLHGKRVVGRRELGKRALHVGLVLGNQRTLGASFAGVAKRIESRTTQAAQALQQPEDGQHPRAEAHLAQFPGERIARRNQGRGKVEHQLVVAFEHAGALVLERAVGVQAGHFVFVLVGEQLGVVARDGFGELGGFGYFMLALAHLLHELAVALGISRVLVGGEVLHTTLDQLIERARDVLAERDHFGWPCNALDLGQVDSRPPAPKEALLVEIDRHAVELDGALEGRRRNRQPALLVGEAQHQHVRGDGVAHH